MCRRDNNANSLFDIKVLLGKKCDCQDICKLDCLKTKSTIKTGN